MWNREKLLLQVTPENLVFFFEYLFIIHVNVLNVKKLLALAFFQIQKSNWSFPK